MKFYLRWLDRHERQRGEEAPVALILCAGKMSETVEYLTQLPPKAVLTALGRERHRFRANIFESLTKCVSRWVRSAVA